MALIIQYKSAYGINGLPTPPYAAPVNYWLNTKNNYWHLQSRNSQDGDYATENLNGSGNVYPVVKTNDVTAGTFFECTDDFPDLISYGAGTSGSITFGLTIFVVFKQSIGNPNNDAFGVLMQGAGIYIARGSGNNVRAKWGVNTPTFLTKNVNNDEYVILCFRSDNQSQYLQINNDTAVSSSDVSGFYLQQKLRVIDGIPANKGIVEIRIYNEFLSGTPLTTAYNELNTYLSTTQQAVISLPDFVSKNSGDVDFLPGATSNSPATISYTSSNTAVATIVSGQVHIVGPGTTNITASQPATTGYTAASALTKSLTVNSQAVISFPSLSPVTMGAADFSPGATSNSPSQINYATSNAAVAAIINGKIHLVGVGTAVITASQSATTGFTAATPVSQTLTATAAVVQNTATTSNRPAGLWFMDGIDLFQVFSIIINEGTAELLKLPGRKDSTTHDWTDSNGLDIDVSRIFLKERRFILDMSILANSEDDFWRKHSQFITNLIQPGLRRLEFAAHNNRSYFVVYDDNSSYKQITKLQAISGTHLIAHSFNLSFIEPEPALDPGNVFVVTDDGRFLIS